MIDFKGKFMQGKGEKGKNYWLSRNDYIILDIDIWQ